MSYNMNTDAFYTLPKWGCAVWLKPVGCTVALCSVPLWKNGSPKNIEQEGGEIVYPETQDFLDACNEGLGSNYTLEDFPGG